MQKRNNYFQKNYKIYLLWLINNVFRVIRLFFVRKQALIEARVGAGCGANATKGLSADRNTGNDASTRQKIEGLDPRSQPYYRRGNLRMFMRGILFDPVDETARRMAGCFVDWLGD